MMNPLLEKVLRRIVPTEEENRRILEVAERIIEKIESMGGRFKRIKVVGSVARGTNLKDSSDVDIFLLYGKEVTRSEMEKEILRIGSALGAKTKYAEHPYVFLNVDGVDVDIVPAYLIGKGERPVSATDRSPLHQEFVARNLKDWQKNEVRLLKAFLRGIGCYGAEIRTRGFSGYLAELLVIHYGSFENVLKDASVWIPPVFIDISGRSKTGKGFFTVVDPVDPRRNVAAAVSMEKFSTFVLASRKFLENPSEVFFFPPSPPCSVQDIRSAIIRKRGKYLVVRSSYPENESPDVVWGEIQAMLSLFRRKLSEDFDISCSRVWTDESSEILFIFHVCSERTSDTVIRRGPLVFDEKNTRRFINKYRDCFFGPWVEGNRVYVEVFRVQHPPELVLFREVEKMLKKRKYAKLLSNVEILSGREILSIVRDENLHFFYDAIIRRPPWL